MTTQQWLEKGAYFEYKGQQIFYQEATNPDAPTILLLHGFPTASWDWHKIWPSLGQQFHLIAPDFIGYGFSDKPEKHPYSIIDQAALCKELLLQKNITKAHILAHDYGDTVAQELLAQFLEGSLNFEIESLCLLNGGLFAESHRPRLIQKLLLSPIGRFLSPFVGKSSLHKNFKRIFGPNTQPTLEEIDEFWKLVDYNNGKKIFHLLIRYIPERRQYRERWVSALQNNSIPIRLINGPKDPISGQHMVDRYRELISNPDVVVLENIGHYPNTEAPQALLKHYLEFVTKS
ncbi:MAG: alpha/beta hydrolase [Aureispira sp.]|nr:alpha/beta hydrolase [Aureispira sp.]